MPHKVPANPEPLVSLIHEIRGERVILDADLARVYGVEARVLNQTVKRNPERFPSDFAFQLTAREAVDLKSQIGISNSQESAGKGVTMNSSQIVMSSRRGKSYRP